MSEGRSDVLKRVVARALASLRRPEALQKLLAFASLIILVAFFSLAARGFWSFSNFVSIMVSSAVIGVLGVGVTFVIISGGIDLSIASVMAFSMMMTGVFITNLGTGVFVGVVGGIATGGMCGLVNGLLVSRLKIPPFIATLGMMMIARGLALIVTDTTPVYFPDNPGFKNLATGSLLGGIDVPNAVLIFILSAVVASVLLKKTVLGLYTYALGSNEEAARLSGIPTRLWKTVIYTIGGLYCGLAGVLMASRLDGCQPSEGQSYELEAIAAVVIGGTSLSGGEGSILGTVIGALLLNVLTNGLSFMEVSDEWRKVVIGGVVIAAVYADIVRRRRMKR